VTDIATPTALAEAEISAAIVNADRRAAEAAIATLSSASLPMGTT